MRTRSGYRIDFEQKRSFERPARRWIESKTTVSKVDESIYRIFASTAGVALYCIVGLVALYFLVR